MNEITEPTYCSKCIVQEGWGTVLSENDGLCPSCRKSGVNVENVSRLSQLMQNLKDFQEHIRQNKGGNNHDCLLMLSGGKDSTYMLYKLVKIDKCNPLAYTFKNPFESVNAIHNIERTIKKLEVCHIDYTPNLGQFRLLLKHIFSLTAEEVAARGHNVAPEKLPCSLCTFYMMTVTQLLAMRMQIPYILYCADPEQIRMFSFDVRENIEVFRRYCNDEITYKIFGNQLDELMNTPPEQLPKIVLPYLTERYAPGEIIAEVKKLGLYETSPSETHCQLYGMLQYFSIKNFNRYFYASEIASQVRKGIGNREKFIYGIRLFKNYIMQIAENPNVGDAAKANLKGLLRQMYSSDSEVDYVYNSIINIHNTAKELGVEL